MLGLALWGLLAGSAAAGPAVAPPRLPPGLKPCAARAADGWHEPATLDALLDCQSALRSGWIDAYRDAHGGEPPASALDALDAYQRKEAASYAARHPDRAQTDAQAAAGAHDGPFEDQQRRTAAAMQANEQQVDPSTARDLDALNAALVSSSQGGTLGVTPEGARAIADYLKRQQGGASPDMQALLDQLSHDGGKLSDQSMVKLKQAARAAKGAGLDLGVDPKLQGWLLDPTTDPAPPSPGAL